MDYQKIRNALERLTGQKATGIEPNPEISILRTAGEGLGYSQLNELLLLLGFDRISRAFFRYLIDGDTRYETGMAFETEQQLEDSIEKFQKLAILLYGSVKFAFKVLSRAENLEKTIKNLDPITDAEFRTRHRPILPIMTIPAEETYLTGYLIERELRDKLQQDPEDSACRELEAKRIAAVEAAKKNQQSYLASDHLDVYVATSMREKHEFKAINRITGQIFSHHALCDLNLRWFDPTQAYCQNRIDKGLAEALMLRRASCTIYLAQEVDTLGKDSELASTLAQGKPVVAYIPEVSREDFDMHLEELKNDGLPSGGEKELLISQLSIYYPEAAWKDPKVQSWIANQSQPTWLGASALVLYSWSFQLRPVTG
jgi:hypothetical protein